MTSRASTAAFVKLNLFPDLFLIASLGKGRLLGNIITVLRPSWRRDYLIRKKNFFLSNLLLDIEDGLHFKYFFKELINA